MANRCWLFPRQKALALLAYLAVKRGPQPRGHLCALLWEEVNEATARQSLSTLLSTLRHALGSHDDPDEEHLIATPESVALVRRGDDWYDIDEFEATLRTLEHLDAGLDASSAEALGHALSLYRDSFLDGLSLRDNVAFEDWVLQQRTRLELLALDGLRSLVAYHERRGAFAVARDLAQRALALDDLDETMHATMLRLLVATGHHGAAQRHYLTTIATLTREMGEVPPHVMRVLRDELQWPLPASDTLPLASVDLSPAASTAPTTIQSPLLTSFSALSNALEHNRDDTSIALIGRRRELTLLRDALRPPDDARRPVLVVLDGSMGLGKSRLLREALAAIQPGHSVIALCGRRLQQAVPYWPLLAARQQGNPAFVDTTTSVDPSQAVVTWTQQLIDSMAHASATVVLDAAQWADAWTLRVLDALLSGAHGPRPLLVLALRPHQNTPELAALLDEWSGHGASLRITLAPLLEEDVCASLITEGSNGEVASRLARWLIEATAGLPDLLTMTLASLRSLAIISPDARTLTVDFSRLTGEFPVGYLPAPIHPILRRHLADLGPMARSVLEMCAASHGTITPTSFNSTHPQDSSMALDLLVARHLLILESDEWGARYRLAVPALGRFALDEMGTAQRTLLLEKVSLT